MACYELESRTLKSTDVRTELLLLTREPEREEQFLTWVGKIVVCYSNLLVTGCELTPEEILMFEFVIEIKPESVPVRFVKLQAITDEFEAPSA